jgi:hypothetical protein
MTTTRKTQSDLLADAVAAVRRLQEAVSPSAKYAVIVVHVGDGVPDVSIPVTPVLSVSRAGLLPRLLPS